MKRLLAAAVTCLAFGLHQAQGQESDAAKPLAASATAIPAAPDTTQQKHLAHDAGVAPTASPAKVIIKPTLPALATLPKDRATPSLPLTEIYRIGPGDVLDVRLRNFTSRQSSLFTVKPDGTIDYPYLSEPLTASDLTPEALAARLNQLIKVFDQPQTVVTVRYYASHAVTVTGLAAKPGFQALQREAVPLYVLLTLVEPKPEATRVILNRPQQPVQEIMLARTEALNLLILPGDVIHLDAAPVVSPATREFFYIIGIVGTHGQREFHQGLTLTQAIFAAGGLTGNKAGKARLLRQTTDGRLQTLEYSLKRINQGKDPDPPVQAGDRLEILDKD